MAILEQLNALSRGGVAVLADAGVKSAVVLLAAAIAAKVLRQAPAAVRHRVWSLGLCGALVMPLLSWMLPQMRLPVLPAKAAPAKAAGEPRGATPTKLSGKGAARVRDPNEETRGMKAAPFPRQEFKSHGAAGPIRREELTAAQLVLHNSSRDDGLLASRQTAAPLDARVYVLGVWIAGLAMVLAPLAAGFGVNWLLVRKSRRITHAQWLRLIAELSARIGLTRTVAAFESPQPVVPMTWGLLRPMVLVPADWRDWPEERQRCVLLHELAHIRRLDVVFQMIGRVAAAWYWFNPLVWFGVRQLRIERELACDDCVLASGERASDYARELLRIARLYRPRPLAVGVAMAHSARLDQRVLRILDQARSRLPMSRRAARSAFVAAAALVLGVAATSLVERSTSAVEGEEKPARPTRVVDADVVSSRSNHVNAVAVSSDGRLVAGGGMDRSVRIWKLPRGELLHQLEGSQQVIRAVAFQPKGALLASAGDEPVVRIWDVAAGAQVKKLRGLRHVNSIGFSPDGKFLAGCSFEQKEPKQWQGDVVVWDVDAGETVRVVETQANGYYRGVAFSPDGSLLAAAFSSTGSTPSSGVKLWDTKSWELKQTLLRDRGASLSVAFSPDGRHIASGGGFVEIVDGRMATGEVKVWEIESGNIVRTLARPGGGGYVAIAFSPLGSIAGQGFGPVVKTPTGSSVISEITNWNPGSEQVIWNLRCAFCGDATPPAFTPDGITLITCDTEAVRVLDAQSGETLHLLMKAERSPVSPETEDGAVGKTSNAEVDGRATGAAAREGEAGEANDPEHADAATKPNSTKTADKVGNSAAPKAKLVTLRGRCVDDTDHSAMAGIPVRLFKAEGRIAPIVEAARTATDDQGRFEFRDFVPPRPHDPVDQLVYLLFAEADDRRLGSGGTWTMVESDPLFREINILRDSTTFSGTIFNSRRQPIAGATVAQWAIDGRGVPGMLSATTGDDGQFEINRIPDLRKRFGRDISARFTVSHPDYPLMHLEVLLPADLDVVLSDGCVVTGMVADSVTGKPAVGAIVTATDDKHGETPAVTGAEGRFQMVLAEGRYTFRADAHDRVCVALVDRECGAGEKVDLPLLKLIGGGFISGRVINAATGEPVAESNGRPIMLGLTGPTHPLGKVPSPARLATVDANGRFTLRAAPGENFPYFVNIMWWDSHNQPPVIVNEGQTTEYDMLITPPISPEEKVEAARKLVDALPKNPSDRTAQILLEFRKLNQISDQTELCCLLMRELVAIGHEAVPQVCTELDRSTEDRMLRLLGFALRAIGDPRAVPALIRAIPKTLVPSSSDAALIVNDKELAAFMQLHDLREGKGGAGVYFDLGRPVREVFGALHVLTRHDFHDSELFSMNLSKDPRRQILQRRICLQHALRWQAWWEANWRMFTDDAAYQKVNVNGSDEPLPPAPDPQALPKTTRVSGEWQGTVISPAIEQGKYAWHFYDLDTGFRPDWPAGIGRDEAALDSKKLRDWAFQMGIDLMCVTYRSPDGTETYVLRALGMNVWEIAARDLRDLDRLLAAGTLPKGWPVDELLMHYDTGSQQLVPDANAVFLFITRDGNMGVIETTDRVTRVTGPGGRPTRPPGTGFHKGVRFNLWAIVP